MTQDIHFVTGKGGVGKSIVAAALAFREASRGRKTLLVELGDRSFFRDFFSLSDVRYEATNLRENLDVAIWSGRESLREYARHLIKVEALTKLFFENPVSRSLIDIAPALPELAVLGKITSGPRKHGPPMEHEVIVVDAFSTGHFLALLRAPRGMAEAVRIGPMGEQSRGIMQTLADEKLCHTHVVTLPEEMPVKETEELVAKLRAEFELHPDIILNKIVSTDVPEDALKADHPFAKFLRETKTRQDEMRARLKRLEAPVRELPLVLEDDPVKLIETLARELA